jgi:hypothetical protein
LGGNDRRAGSPSKDEVCARWRAEVTFDRPPLMGLHTSSESCQRVGVVPYWFDTPLFAVGFPPGYSPDSLGPEVFLRLSSPCSLRPHDYPLLRFGSPPGYYPRSLPDGLSAPAPSLGFLPLRRHQRRESTSPGFASPGTFRSRGFAPPHRFSPPDALRVCFAPLASMGFRPPGVFPPKKPPPSHRRRSCPLDVLSRSTDGHDPSSLGAPATRS